MIASNVCIPIYEQVCSDFSTTSLGIGNLAKNGPRMQTTWSFHARKLAQVTAILVSRYVLWETCAFSRDDIQNISITNPKIGFSRAGNCIRNYGTINRYHIAFAYLPSE